MTPPRVVKTFHPNAHEPQTSGVSMHRRRCPDQLVRTQRSPADPCLDQLVRTLRCVLYVSVGYGVFFLKGVQVGFQMLSKVMHYSMLQKLFNAAIRLYKCTKNHTICGAYGQDVLQFSLSECSQVQAVVCNKQPKV